MVSGYDMSKSGCQILIVKYKEHTTKLTIVVFEKFDFNCDGDINASDITILKKELLCGVADNSKFDINGDGCFYILDLVNIKKSAVKADT